MLTIPELEKRLELNYTREQAEETKNKRMFNIQNTSTLYKKEIEEEGLRFEGKEERIFLYKTKNGEMIFVQIPGKESTRDEKKRFPFDARPCIMLPNGRVVKNMAFKDIWHVAEDINERHRGIMNCLGAMFFHDGRMTLHNKVDETVRCEIVLNNAVVSTKTVELNWYKLLIDDEIIESLNYNVADIEIDGDECQLSFEAFIYFFDLLIQNEDNKYFYKKHNLTSGRITTSDSMLLLNSYFLGETRLSNLLQRYVSGFGVGKCNKSEIEPSTGHLIKQ